MKKILFFSLILIVNQFKAQVCFKPINTFSVTGGTQTPQAVASGNLNSNSATDFVMADNAGNNIAVLLDYNASLATVSATTTYSIAAGASPTDVVIGNFNNDANGYMDILTVNRSLNTISVFLGAGDGTFGLPISFSTGPNVSPQSATAGDFNGDGKIDIAIITTYSMSYSAVVLLNVGTVGTCSFTIGSTYTANISNPMAIESLDIDSDHDSDLVIGNYGGGNIAIYKNGGTGTFTTAGTYTVSYLYGLAKGDFNHDGKTDIASVNQISGASVSIFINSSTGGVPSFSTATSYSPTISYPQTLTIGDFNADNNLDIIAATPSQAAFLKGNGGGTFSTASTYTFSTPTLSTIISGDYNNDGTPDLAFEETSLNSLGILINTQPKITGPTAVCQGSSISLTASGSSTYTWSTSATTSSISITPTSGGIYSVTATTGSCTLSNSTYITVNNVPTISVTATSNVFCYGGNSGSANITITNGNNPFSITQPGWSTPTSGTVSTSGNTSLYAGTQSVTVTDYNGCTATQAITITQPAQATITVSSPSICIGATATLTANGASTYTWSPGTVVSQTITESPTTTSFYTVQGTDATGCDALATTATVTVNQLPVITFTGTTTICKGSTTTITPGGANASYNYTWTPGPVISTALTLSPNATTTYTVSGTDNNLCVGTNTVTVLVNTYDAISGTVYDTAKTTTPQGIISGIVYLYQRAASHDTSVGLIPLSGGGTYNFSQVPPGNYFIRAVADAAYPPYQNTIGTYYTNPIDTNAYTWDLASIIVHSGCNSGTDGGHDITVIETPAQLGTGTISGVITSDGTYGHRLGYNGGHDVPQGVPLKGVDVKAGKNPGGNCAAKTTSDNSGGYVFTNVDTGSYFIYTDLPNFGMDTVLKVSITPQNQQSLNNNYCVDSVSVGKCSAASGIATFANGNNLAVYPNPTTGLVSFYMKDYENATVEVYNVIGQKVYATSVQNNLTQINLQNVPNGVYSVRVVQGNLPVYQAKVIKQE